MSRIPSSMAGTEIRTSRMTITPEIAKRWLGQNTEGNRNISKRTVEAYARDMKAGEWAVTHQGIAFNQVGELVDGQHRLHAVILADVAIESMVTTGLRIEYNSPLDQGYNRSLGQITGKGTRWVSVVRGLHTMEEGLADSSFRSTVSLIEDCATRHEEAITACLTACKSARSCPTGLVAALAFAYPVNPDKILSLGRQIDSGELLVKGDPALTLRKWVAQGRHSPRETILATLAAAKSTLQGKPITAITAGLTGGGRDGSSNYSWFVFKRRALKLPGTPSVAIVPPYPKRGAT